MLGSELQTARAAAGLTQEELAAKAGVSREYVSLLENGRKSPTVHVLLRLCRAMGVAASDVIARVERAG
ncbi:MAG: family transcriptional regulator [Phycisphaerales bacterium]|nr:family transcriptional regulator [Phycisphaerales bacterium]